MARRIGTSLAGGLRRDLPVVGHALGLFFAMLTGHDVDKATGKNAQLYNTFANIGSIVREVGSIAKTAFGVIAVGVAAAAGPVEKLTGFLSSHKAVVISLVAAYVAFKVATSASAAILTSIKGVMIAAAIAQKLFGTATAEAAAETEALDIALLANPIGLVIAGVAALTAGVIYAYTHFKTFRSIVNGVWTVVRTVFRGIADYWLTTVQVIIHGAALAFGWVPGIGKKLRSADSHFTDFKNRVLTALGGAKTGATHAGRETGQAFNDGVEDKKPGAKQAGKDLHTAVDEGFNAQDTKTDPAKNLGQSLITGPVTQLGPAAYDGGSRLAQEFGSGFLDELNGFTPPVSAIEAGWVKAKPINDARTKSGRGTADPAVTGKEADKRRSSAQGSAGPSETWAQYYAKYQKGDVSATPPVYDNSADVAKQKKAAKAAADKAKAKRDAAVEQITNLIGAGFVDSLVGADPVKIRKTIARLVKEVRIALPAGKANPLVHMLDSERDALIRNAAALKANETALAKATAKRDKVKDLREAVSSAAFGTLTQLKSPAEIRNYLAERIAQIGRFATNIATLKKRGLPAAFLSQIINDGLNGAAEAEALAHSSNTDFTAIVKETNKLTAVSNSLGDTATKALYGTTYKAAQGLVDGLNARHKDLEAAGRRLGNAIVKGIHEALGIHSPSRVGHAVGLNLGTSVGGGVLAAYPHVDAAVAGLVKHPVLTDRRLVPRGRDAGPVMVRLHPDDLDRVADRLGERVIDGYSALPPSMIGVQDLSRGVQRGDYLRATRRQAKVPRR